MEEDLTVMLRRYSLGLWEKTDVYERFGERLLVEESDSTDEKVVKHLAGEDPRIVDDPTEMAAYCLKALEETNADRDKIRMDDREAGLDTARYF